MAQRLGLLQPEKTDGQPEEWTIHLPVPSASASLPPSSEPEQEMTEEAPTE